MRQETVSAVRTLRSITELMGGGDYLGSGARERSRGIVQSGCLRTLWRGNRLTILPPGKM